MTFTEHKNVRKKRSLIVSYKLESAEEAKRLQEQEKMEAYSIAQEFGGFQLPEQSVLLDAGCGEGALSRFFRGNYPSLTIEACDLSEIRLKQAQETNAQHDINFFHSNLETIAKDSNLYDAIVCRYVFEHLQDPLKVAREFARVLRPGGKAWICDLDNLFIGFHTVDDEFNSVLQRVSTKVGVDLYMGRKIPAILRKAGFKIQNTQMYCHQFSGEGLEQEKKNYLRRFSQMETTFKRALRGIMEFEEFRDRYITLMDDNGSNMFLSKFVVEAVK